MQNSLWLDLGAHVNGQLADAEQSAQDDGHLRTLAARHS
jgi:hypothetical protein